MALLDRAIGPAIAGGNLVGSLTIALSASRSSRAIRGGGVFAGAAKPGSPQGQIPNSISNGSGG